MLRLNRSLVAGKFLGAAGLLAVVSSIAGAEQLPINKYTTAEGLSYRACPCSVPSPEQQPAQPKITSQDTTVAALAPGQIIEHEVSGRQTWRYEVTAGAGQLVGVKVRQSVIDVRVKVFAPDGKLVVELDDRLSPLDADRAEFVAETTGAYRLDVESKYKNASGRYEIGLTEVRAATERDRLLLDAQKLVKQALTFGRGGRYSDGVSLAERALKIGERELGPNHAYVGYVLDILGVLHSNKGSFTMAVQVLQRALAINQKEDGPEGRETIESMRDLGLTYGFLDEFQKGEELLQRALQLTEKKWGSDDFKFGRCLTAIGTLHSHRSDLARAEQELQRAIMIEERALGPDDSSLEVALNNLGLLYNSRREYDRAEPLLKRALALLEAELGPDSPGLALPLQNLGLIAQEKMKDYPAALDLYWRAVRALEKGSGPESPDAAGILNNIANIYKTQGDFARALELHARVYSIFENSFGPYHGLTLVSIGNVARTYGSMGDVQNAIKFQALTDDVIEKNLTLNLTIGSERQKLAYFDSLKDRTDRTVSLHLNMAPDDAGARDLAVLAILQRKGRVLDAMSITSSALRRRLNAEDQQLFDDLNGATAQFAKLVLNGPGQTPLDDFRKQVTALGERKETLESEISRRSAEFRAQTQPVTLAAVQAAIPRDAVLIEFAIYRPFNPRLGNAEAYGEPRYVAYVVRQQSEVRWRELGPSKEIDARVAAWREVLRDPARKDTGELARALDERLMQPLRGLVRGSEHLLISPDGPLNLIPFGALIDEQGKYLVQEYTISYLTSGRDLLRLQVLRESTGPAVVLADPAFGEPQMIGGNAKTNGGTQATGRAEVDYSRQFFGPLPGAADEVRTLRELIPQASFLTKEQATKAALESLSGPPILHIATHGFFLAEPRAAAVGTASTTRAANGSPASSVVPAGTDNPLLRSGLALAGANQSNDGILTALEASGLNLWGTKLVILSACDTGVGEVKNGDGVYGLRRALVLAGAESQMMSLWPASDRSTRDLTAGYYRALLKGAGRSEALRQAQLQMMKVKPHPYYWAGFIQAGEWANLEGKR